jgi:hypothetical protein
MASMLLLSLQLRCLIDSTVALGSYNYTLVQHHILCIACAAQRQGGAEGV